MATEHILIDVFLQNIQHIISGVFLVGLFYFAGTVGHRPKGCPPGPPTLPIVGNLLQLPKKDIHLAYQKWARKYGPIFSLQLGQRTAVVVANGAIVKGLLDKKSYNYSDRPDSYLQELYGHSRIIMRSYDELWKAERKLYHQFLNSTIASKYAPYQSVETKKLLYDLLTNPDAFDSHLFRMSASIGSSMVYGFRIASKDNDTLQLMLHNAHGFFHLADQGRFLDYYPGLKRLFRLLPHALNPIAKVATKYYRSERTMFVELLNEAKLRAQGKDALPSFAADIAHAQETWKENDVLTEQAAAYIAGIAFEAGADTTSNQLLGFLQAMALYPEVRKKAQAQLDDVVGDDRLPTMDDIQSLPYIRAVVKETLRWFPTARNGGFAHAARNEDEYQGHVIPKGATVILSVWSCNNDPDRFDDPRAFVPERQNVDASVGEDSVAQDYLKRTTWGFGCARRICPGMHLAEKSLLLATARILWAFDIEMARDKSGKIIPIDPEAATQAIACRPLPFKCAINSRSEKRARIIRKEWYETEALLDGKGNYKQSILGL